mmetsp:Transcript_56870/g.165128  ORF Transcript_56870/g.165128 Transcript_56870/m.165128 type:complete len:241 (-) Transcript_56870:335-1057(-)
MPSAALLPPPMLRGESMRLLGLEPELPDGVLLRPCNLAAVVVRGHVGTPGSPKLTAATQISWHRRALTNRMVLTSGHVDAQAKLVAEARLELPAAEFGAVLSGSGFASAALHRRNQIRACHRLLRPMARLRRLPYAAGKGIGRRRHRLVSSRAARRVRISLRHRERVLQPRDDQRGNRRCGHVQVTSTARLTPGQRNGGGLSLGHSGHCRGLRRRCRSCSRGSGHRGGGGRAALRSEGAN